MSLLAAMLLACVATPVSVVARDPVVEEQGGPAPTAEDTGIAGPDLPHVDAPTNTATWSAAEVGVALESALSAGLPDPRYEHDQYLALLSHGGPECPGHETYIDDRFVYGCNAVSGYYYSGVSNYLSSDETIDGARIVEVEVNGDFLFRDPLDHVFEVGGHTRIHTTWPADGASGERWLEHSGTWLWERHESWLQGGASGRFSMTLRHGDDGRELVVEGAVGFGGIWMAFEDMVLTEEACGWAPTGVAEVRDPGGAWHRLDFGASCTPCAAVVFDGATDLGEVCVDLSALPHALSGGWEDL